jgi:hypothetical protein
MVTVQHAWTPAFEVVKKGHRIVTPAQAEVYFTAARAAED